MDASLVMRDRETDSWWSIMTSDAIGGELDGVGAGRVSPRREGHLEGLAPAPPGHPGAFGRR